MAWIGHVRPCKAQALCPPIALRGDYAIAALSGEELVLARGRFGGRPLYWAINPQDGAAIACSELAPLVGVLKGARLNASRFAASLVRATQQDHSQTHYEGIYRVPSACVLRIGRQGVRVRHDVPFDVEPRRVGPIRQVADEMRGRIFEAVSRALDGVDHVGVLVSGGLDSSLLLAATVSVARQSGKCVEAINLHFAAQGDDRPHLRALCEMLRVMPVRVTPSECGAGLGDTLVIDRAPVGWPQAPFEISLTRRSHEQGATLLLTGSGGDEVFGGDFRVYAQRARQGHVISALRSVVHLKGLGLPAKRRLRLLLLDPLIASGIQRIVQGPVVAWQRSRSAPRWAGPQLRRFLRAGGLDPDSHFEVRLQDGRSWLAALARSGLYLDTSEARAHAELAGGCKRAEPFLDDDLVEFVASLSPEVLSHDDWWRGLLRYAMRGLVPETLRLRPDKGHFGPVFPQVLEAAGGFSSLEPLVKATALADLGLVDTKRFRERFDDLVRAPTAGGLWLEIWPVLAGEAFLRQEPGLS